METRVTQRRLMEGAASAFQDGAARLCRLWRSQERWCVLDTFFGDASDFKALKEAWKADPGACQVLHYVALCGDCFSAPTPELECVWPLPIAGHHPITLPDEPRVKITLVFGEIRSALRHLAAVFDLILLKGGASPVSDLARVSRFGTAIETRSEDEGLLDLLQNVGFILVRDAAGTFGKFRGRHRRSPLPPPHEGDKSAIVIGAGLAGTAVASSLATRGWNVTVLERQPAPALEASGNLSAAISPMVSKDDGVAARLSRASFFALLKELKRSNCSGRTARWSSCGLLQMARNGKEESSFKELLRLRSYPSAYASFLSKEEAQHLVGWDVPAGGIFFPQGGWMNPASLCHARLHFSNIRAHFDAGVSKIVQADGVWGALDHSGNKLAEAPVLILANAFEAALFAQTNRLHFKKVRGQVTHVPAEQLPFLKRVITRDGYLTPEFGGFCSLGATYEFDSGERDLQAGSQRKNLERLSSLLNGVRLTSLELSGRVGFRSLTADRLPVVGRIPDFDCAVPAGQPLHKTPRQQGLYALLGLGSRGGVWSTLAGEILAAMIEGEPSPVASDLLGAIDPARFLARAKSL